MALNVVVFDVGEALVGVESLADLPEVLPRV
jgi:hypothetical protein